MLMCVIFNPPLAVDILLVDAAFARSTTREGGGRLKNGVVLDLTGAF